MQVLVAGPLAASSLNLQDPVATCQRRAPVRRSASLSLQVGRKAATRPRNKHAAETAQCAQAGNRDHARFASVPHVPSPR